MTFTYRPPYDCVMWTQVFHPTAWHLPLRLTRNLTSTKDTFTHMINMQPPRTINEVNRLIEKMATLNCFISRTTDKYVPFFKVLPSKSNFPWDHNYYKTFEDLKEYLRYP